MFEREERELREWKETLSGIPIPDPERLGDAVKAGVLKSKRTDIKWARKLAIAIAAVLLFFVIGVSIRVLPAFASMIGHIPGMTYIVNLIGQQDNGLKQAIENDFIQPVGRSSEQDGIRLTVEGIIADESRVNIFYKAEHMDGSKKELNTRSVKLRDDTGAELQAFYSCCSTEERLSKDNAMHSQVDLTMAEGIAVPDTIVLQVKLAGDSLNPDTVWEVPIPVERQRFSGLKETMVMNRTLDIDGQRMTFTKATVYPTKIDLEVEFDPGNTKQIMGFEDLKLVTDQGQVLKNSSAWMGETKQTIAFESDYFAKSKQLTLLGSKLLALDKSKRELIIDMENEKLVQVPDDRLTLKSIVKTGTSAAITLETKTLGDDQMAYSIVDQTYIGSDGKKHMLSGGRETSFSMGSAIQSTVFHVEEDNWQGLLTFTIINYPSRIEQPFEIGIR